MATQRAPKDQKTVLVVNPDRTLEYVTPKTAEVIDMVNLLDESGKNEMLALIRSMVGGQNGQRTQHATR